MTTRGQVRNAYPACKVYIYGIDVTLDVLDVDVRWQNGRAPNIASISLVNPNDRYIFTTKDLVAIYDDKKLRDAASRTKTILTGTSYTDETADTNSYYTASDPDYDTIDAVLLENARHLTPDVKRNVVSQKITIRTDNVSQLDISGQESTLKPLTATAYRYPFQAEDPIFHANDPVRIFFRDPWDSTRWYHMMTGFITDFDDHVDENNQAILTITVEGTTKQFRYARINSNPTAVLGQNQKVKGDAENPSFYSAGFYNLTLPEILFIATFGYDPTGMKGKFLVKNGPHGESLLTASFDGVGSYCYERSAVVEYGGSGASDPVVSSSNITTISVGSLSEYQSLIDHEVKVSDLTDMILYDHSTTGKLPVFDDNKKNDPLYIMDYIGTRPNLYPVGGGRLIILVPKNLNANINREILLKDIAQSSSLQTELKSRLGIIHDTMERIEFSFHESPKGDLICEFPLYDFDPSDFGLNSTVPHASIENGVIVKHQTVKRGPFGNRYCFEKRDTYNYSKGISDEKVRTQMSCFYSLIQNYTPGGSSEILSNPKTVILNHLLDLYGTRLEQAPLRGYIHTPEAALAYAQLLLNMCNADARSLGINAVPNFGVCLNRPIYFKQKNCIGCLVSTNHSIKWNSSVDTRLNLRYIRGWDGLIDKYGNPVLTPIGGLPSNPFDYKTLFGLRNVDSGAAKMPTTTNTSPNFKHDISKL